MKVTRKGQVTIPQHIRHKLGITPYSEVTFIEEEGRVYFVLQQTAQPGRFHHLRGVATTRLSTDEIIALTRGT